MISRLTCIFRKHEVSLSSFVILLTSCLFFLPFQSQAQEASDSRGAISGRVLEKITRAPVVGANVVIVGGNRGAATDIDGGFLIENLAPGAYQLQVTRLGYLPSGADEIRVQPNRTLTLEILLEATYVEGEEVTFTAGYFSSDSPDLPTSARSLRYEEVRRAPGAAEDVQRVIQALPGVAGESDQNNEIVVRGGDPSENLIVMDGIEVENINHFGYIGSTGGPVSALNSEFLRDVTFASGGFSARYGDKLSSVLELDLREGSRDHFTGAVDLGMAGFGGNIEGPINNGKGSYMIAARKSYMDWIVSTGSTGLTSVPYYWNTQAKLNYDLTPRHLLTANLLTSNDWILIDDEEEGGFSRGAEKVDTNSDRIISGMRLRSLWGVGYSDLIIAGTSSNYFYDVYDINTTAGGDRTERNVFRQTVNEQTWQASLHWQGSAFGHDDWSAGAIWKPVRFNEETWVESDTIVFNDGYLGPPDGQPDIAAYDDIVNNGDLFSHKYGGYLQYRWRPTANLSLLTGVRYDGFELSNEHTVAPRVSMIYSPTPRWNITAAWGIYRQAQSLYLYSWDPDGSNHDLDHIRTDQYVLGTSFEPRSSTRLSLEGYFKDYSGLLVSEEDVVRETEQDYYFNSYRFLDNRKRTAWGVEFFAQQRLATNWYGTFSYSYGKSETDDEAWGTYPAEYDFRHVMTVVAGYKTSLLQQDWYRKQMTMPWKWLLMALPINGDELQVSSRFRYISGKPTTPRIWYPVDTVSPDPIYEGHWADGSRHSDNLSDYARWDVRLDNRHYYGKRSLTFYLEAQNILDRANVASYAYADDGEIDDIYQFRFFFVGGMRFEF